MNQNTVSIPVSANFDKVLGRVKPLHGVGSGPVTGNFTFDTTEHFRRAGIPYSRTHDTEYPFGSGEYVDIHCIFPDFEKDPEDPAAYNFLFTDEYLKAIENAGAQVFYRLGSTIEHQPIKRYIHPPKDYTKWARICEHIILHYNEGWANGFHMGIQYWEIWNEPDLQDRCWTGTEEEFFSLYGTAATLLKNRFPGLKIGGCAFTCTWTPMVEAFLAYVAEHAIPLDFFSWHGYIHTPEQALALADNGQRLLDKYGLTAESIYDEWNYVYEWDDTIQKSIELHTTAHCAALLAGVMTALQKQSTVSRAMYYDSQVRMTSWNGLFRAAPMRIHGEPVGIVVQRPFRALEAFGTLYRLGQEIDCVSGGAHLYAMGARGDSGKALLITWYDDEVPFGEGNVPDVQVELQVAGADQSRAEYLLLDKTHDLEPVQFPDGIRLSNGSVLLVRYPAE